MGWTYTFPKLSEPESFHKSYPSGVLPDNFLAYNFFEDEKSMKGYALEVGVDLELCVHAHGHDVDHVMEASLIIIITLV